MKLTAGVKNIDLPLNEELEEKLFLEFSGIIYREFKLQANKETVEEFADELMKKNVVATIATFNPEIKSIKVPSERQMPLRRDSKLIIGKCKCGKHYSIWLDNDKSFYNYICSKCESNIYIHEKNLVESSYRCNECNRKYSFWSNGKDEYMINCKNCRAEISMKYDSRNEVMASSNLL